MALDGPILAVPEVGPAYSSAVVESVPAGKAAVSMTEADRLDLPAPGIQPRQADRRHNDRRAGTASAAAFR